MRILDSTAGLAEAFLQARQLGCPGAQLLVRHLRERDRGRLVRLVQVAHRLVQIEQPGDDLAPALLLLGSNALRPAPYLLSQPRCRSACMPTRPSSMA
jgi:hypothetical protein